MVQDKVARGVALVEEAIAALEKQRGKKQKPEPMTAAAIKKLGAIPPSLARALAYDRSWFAGTPKWQPFASLMREEFGDATADIYDGLFSRFLGGECLLLPGGADSRHFVYRGVPDESGELPVFMVDTDDTPYIELAFAGFDLYFASGLVKRVPKVPVDDQARRNFGGFRVIDPGGDSVHVDGEAAADAALSKLMG